MKPYSGNKYAAYSVCVFSLLVGVLSAFTAASNYVFTAVHFNMMKLQVCSVQCKHNNIRRVYVNCTDLYSLVLFIEIVFLSDATKELLWIRELATVIRLFTSTGNRQVFCFNILP